MHIDARMYIAQVSRRLLTLSRWVVDLGGERERESVCVQYKEWLHLVMVVLYTHSAVITQLRRLVFKSDGDGDGDG